VVCAEGATGWPMQGVRKRRCVQGMKAWECTCVLHEVWESARVYAQVRECKMNGFLLYSAREIVGGKLSQPKSNPIVSTAGAYIWRLSAVMQSRSATK